MAAFPLTPEELSHLIGVVYDSALEDNQWQRLLDELRRLVPEVFTAVIGFDGLAGRPIYVHAGIAEEYVESYLNGQMLSNETARYMMDLPVGAIATTSDTIPQDEYVNFDFYKNWLQPQGMGPGVGAILAKSSGRFAAINFAMPHAAEQEVLDRLLPILKLIVPHMVRAQELARALLLSRSMSGTLKGLFDTLALPMIVTDAEGRHQFANEAGKRMLARGAGVALDAEGFVLLDPAGKAKQLHQKIADTCSDVYAATMRFSAGEEAVSICLAPFKASLGAEAGVDTDIFAAGRLCALIFGQTDWALVNLGLLQDAFGLTRREAEVCRMLLSPKSPEEIAEASFRSLDTVRTQIKTVYRKTGASTRSELQDSLAVFRTVGALFENVA